MKKLNLSRLSKVDREDVERAMVVAAQVPPLQARIAELEQNLPAFRARIAELEQNPHVRTTHTEPAFAFGFVPEDMKGVRITDHDAVDHLKKRVEALEGFIKRAVDTATLDFAAAAELLKK